MPTLFKNGVISKNGKNMGVSVPPDGTNASGQNTASGNVPDFLSGGVDKVKDIGQKIFSGVGDTAENFMSNIRGKNLPGKATEISSKETAYWGYGDIEDRDWRVSLSMPEHNAYKQSPLMEPLRQTGGRIVFPYTPQSFLIRIIIKLTYIIIIRSLHTTTHKWISLLSLDSFIVKML